MGVVGREKRKLRMPLRYGGIIGENVKNACMVVPCRGDARGSKMQTKWPRIYAKYNRV